MPEAKVVDPVVGEWREITCPLPNANDFDVWAKYLTEKGRDDLKVVTKTHCAKNGGLPGAPWYILMARRKS